MKRVPRTISYPLRPTSHLQPCRRFYGRYLVWQTYGDGPFAIALLQSRYVVTRKVLLI